ncbi:MAG: ABC transporter permease [Anaerolineae bacterium]|nr:ABC transporter permease [Anaerolineae bacterium]
MTLVANLYRYRAYIFSNALNDLRSRYAGSGFGVLWNILLPVSHILIYTLVFSQIMTMRGSVSRSSNDFILYLCSGLFPWLVFSASVIQGSNALQANARYLNKLPIPEEIFVAKLAVTETLVLGIYLILLLIAAPLLGHFLHWTILLLPLVGILFQILAFGMALLLAPLVILFQDIAQVIGIVLRLGMWLAPIVYADTLLSEQTLAVLRWNPAYYYITTFHDLFLWGHIPPWTTWAIMLGWATVFVGIAYWILQKLRPDLRDAL